jgi:hypothetical protein
MTTAPPDAIEAVTGLRARPPGVERVGELIGDPEARRRWVELALALRAAAGPGGPLEGRYLFHGCSARTAASIAASGFSRGSVCLPGPDSEECQFGPGVHLAEPWIACFYAEDRIESTDDPSLELAVVAVPFSKLDRWALIADLQSVDCPLTSRLGATLGDIAAAWEGSDQTWRDCLRIFGSVAYLRRPGPEGLRVVREAADVDRLVSEATAPDPAPRPVP